MQKIITFLMFNDQAEAAMDLYVSLFKNSRVVSVMRSGEAGPGPAGAFFAGNFELDGQPFSCANGGPSFRFDQGMSLMVNCQTQAEIDHLWESLSEGGEKQPCGWVKDRFGVSWQIIPEDLDKMLMDEDAEKAKRTMEAMLQMGKLDIAELRRAYNG